MKRSPLWTILLVAFVDLIGFGLIIPLQAVYAKRLGASGLTFGLLVGVYSLMQLLFNPILGRWSDRVGRRRVLLISISGSVLSHTLLGFADLAHSLPLLFIARTLDGITGANIATAQAYIADVTVAEERAKGMGLFGAAFGLGFVVGPALGFGLISLGQVVSGPAYSTAWPAFGAAVFSAVALLLVWRLLPESRRGNGVTAERQRVFSLKQLWPALLHPRLRELFALVFSSIFAFVMLEVTIVYMCADRFGVTDSGSSVVFLVFVYIGILMVAVQGGLVGRLARAYGEVTLLAVGPFITALGFVMISILPQVSALHLAWALLILACVPVALGHGLTGPSLNALISRQAGEQRQGMILGLSQGTGSLARAVGPPIGGLLYEHEPSWPYLVGAAVLVCVGLAAIRIRPAQQSALDAHKRQQTGDSEPSTTEL